ncbi:MAG: hypothetical protein ACT4PO_08595 [Actinomycetota bacterium]
MEKEPHSTSDQATSQPEEGPPPFNPDPDIVAFLEGGRKDPKEVWRATAPKRD